jgi:hypothetical protein
MVVFSKPVAFGLLVATSCSLALGYLAARDWWADWKTHEVVLELRETLLIPPGTTNCDSQCLVDASGCSIQGEVRLRSKLLSRCTFKVTVKSLFSPVTPAGSRPGSSRALDVSRSLNASRNGSPTLAGTGRRGLAGEPSALNWENPEPDSIVDPLIFSQYGNQLVFTPALQVDDYLLLRYQSRPPAEYSCPANISQCWLEAALSDFILSFDLHIHEAVSDLAVLLTFPPGTRILDASGVNDGKLAVATDLILFEVGNTTSEPGDQDAQGSKIKKKKSSKKSLKPAYCVWELGNLSVGAENFTAGSPRRDHHGVPVPANEDLENLSATSNNLSEAIARAEEAHRQGASNESAYPQDVVVVDHPAPPNHTAMKTLPFKLRYTCPKQRSSAADAGFDELEDDAEAAQRAVTPKVRLAYGTKVSASGIRLEKMSLVSTDWQQAPQSSAQTEAGDAVAVTRKPKRLRSTYTQHLQDIYVDIQF